MTGGKVLVVQLARLGDLVQTWPLLRRLRQGCPGARLGLLGDRRLRDLHKLGPRLEDYWEVDCAGLPLQVQQNLPAAYDRVQHLAADLQAQGYNLVFNLNFSRLSLLLSYLVGGQIRGYRPAAGGREVLRDPWLALVYALVHARQVNRVHLSDVFRHLAPPAGLEPGPPAIGAKAGEPLIALQLATRHPRRTWPLAAFARLAGLLVDRLGARIWLLGTKAEAPLGDELRGRLPPAQRERVVTLQGRTDILELAARLGEAHLLVSGDTGTLHLATSLGTRTIAVFLGPASCFETGPYGEGHYVFQAEPPCHPCVEAGEECSESICLAMIPPEAVAELAEALYTKGAAPALPNLPAGTRLYRSFLDSLGVNYAPLGADYRFIDLVGLSYRRAGARLLGLDWPASPSPSPALFTEDRRNLEGLVAALNNGVGVNELQPAVARALRPLQAFQEELHRQQVLGREAAELQACLQAVQTGFRVGMEELGAAP